jgi:hypothetical protein
MPRGIVGGIYSLRTVGPVRIMMNIDFEMVSNRTSEVHTNIYDNEPLGAASGLL